MDVLRRAEREIVNGRLWRAREILENAIRHAGYKAKVYEKLGIVLLEMKDLAEAGKYLFLSGTSRPEYEEAIGIFFQKYEKKPSNLYFSFPKSAKLDKLSEYPSAVAEKLRQIGLPEELKDIHGNIIIPLDPENKFDFVIIGCILVVLIILALIILGIVKLFEIIF